MINQMTLELSDDGEQQRENRIYELVSSIHDGIGIRLIAVLHEEELSGDVQKEYEQRFKLKELPKGLTGKSEIRQGLLFDKPGFSLRIREEISNGKTQYSLTCKAFKKSDEAEVEITKEMFSKLWSEILPNTNMEKTRWEHGEWVVDDIKLPKDKKGIVAEIETDKEDEKIELPAGFNVK